jgi:hypothetical protein
MLINLLETINQLLTAGIAITAFSLLLYALSFNLRDKVARSFAFIMGCVVVVFVGEAVASVVNSVQWIETWSRLHWIGLVFLPTAYLQLSDVILATTGRPSRGRRTFLIKITYVISLLFLIAIPFSLLVGPLQVEGVIAPHLKRTPLTWVFSAYYLVSMVWAWVNFGRAYQRTRTRSSRRRMGYLILGALAPALGSYPYLLFGSRIASAHPYLFWLSAIFSNTSVSVLIVLMAYSVAFFGVPWPDRVVKRRLVKWVMRGPVTASTVLAVVTITRRAGGLIAEFAPVVLVGSLLLMQYMITMIAPIWERLFLDQEQERLQLIQVLEERLLTRADLRQLLEAILAAACDRLQVQEAFLASMNLTGLELLVTVGSLKDIPGEDFSQELLEIVDNNNIQTETQHIFSWGEYWVAPLFKDDDPETLLGILGVERPAASLTGEQRQAFFTLVERASQALEDRYMQQQVFATLEDITPQMGRMQQLRAAARYDGSEVLTAQNEEVELDEGTLAEWVKGALTDYWGGPRLSESPLLELKIVQQALDEHDGISVKAVRAILREAIERIRPEGTRKFTLEWVLYNILEMKFLRGRKVRDVAQRLAMSEANLYRKQKVAIDVVAKAIKEMELEARAELENENQSST